MNQAISTGESHSLSLKKRIWIKQVNGNSRFHRPGPLDFLRSHFRLINLRSKLKRDRAYGAGMFFIFYVFFLHFLPQFTDFLPADLAWQLLKKGSQFLF